MKRFLITTILAALVAAGTNLTAQDYPEEYLGLPGDNLNLYAVMKLFQESETLEGFERTLNEENTRINNLDLNGDNYIDYIKVIDYPDGNVHTIVLQAVLGRNESHDVAVFTVERFRDGSVQIQLTGDEALYGRNYIIEPVFAETPNPGYTGRSGRAVRTTTVVVSSWPIVRFIYLPTYSIWHSSWYWGYYPSYWHPWRPYYWHYYYGYHYHWFPHYYSCYHRYDHHRYAHWNDFYYSSKRVYSINVNTRIDRGDYRTTYSRPESRRDGEALFTKVNPDRPLRASGVSTGGNNSRRSASESTVSRQSNTNGKVSSGSRRSTSAVTNRSDVSNSSGQYSGNSRRSTTSVNSNGRGNSSGQNNAATPRSTTTINNRSNTGSTAGQSTVSNRRSSGSFNSNQGSGSESGRGNGSVRNSSGPASNSGTGASAGQSSGSSRRPSATVSERPSSGSSSGQRAQSSGNPGRSSATISQRSSSSSSSGQRAQSSGNSRRSSSSSGSTVRQSSGSSKSGSSSKESGKSQSSDNNKTSRRK